MSGLAAGREKRSNAGSKMSSLLEAEEEDEFYKTTYGGFNEVVLYTGRYSYTETASVMSVLTNCCLF